MLNILKANFFQSPTPADMIIPKDRLYTGRTGAPTITFILVYCEKNLQKVIEKGATRTTGGD